MRLIDADAFDRMLKEAQAECKKNGGNFRYGVLAQVRGNLALFHTADCPQIVRCKDCKYYPNGEGATSWTPCREIITPQGWFCADGKRKEGQ